MSGTEVIINDRGSKLNVARGGLGLRSVISNAAINTTPRHLLRNIRQCFGFQGAQWYTKMLHSVLKLLGLAGAWCGLWIVQVTVARVDSRSSVTLQTLSAEHQRASVSIKSSCVPMFYSRFLCLTKCLCSVLVMCEVDGSNPRDTGSPEFAITKLVSMTSQLTTRTRIRQTLANGFACFCHRSAEARTFTRVNIECL